MATHHATPLTARQLEVLGGAAVGESTKETAARLFVSSGTVQTHRKRARRALGTTNTARAVHRARELGLLDPYVGNGGHSVRAETSPTGDGLVGRALLKVCLARDLSVLNGSELCALAAALLARLEPDDEGAA